MFEQQWRPAYSPVNQSPCYKCFILHQSHATPVPSKTSFIIWFRVLFYALTAGGGGARDSEWWSVCAVAAPGGSEVRTTACFTSLAFIQAELKSACFCTCKHWQCKCVWMSPPAVFILSATAVLNASCPEPASAGSDALKTHFSC